MPDVPKLPQEPYLQDPDRDYVLSGPASHRATTGSLWTPEPWPEVGQVFISGADDQTKLRSIQNYLRARVCVNALVGSFDPIGDVDAWKSSSVTINASEYQKLLGESVRIMRFHKSSKAAGLEASVREHDLVVGHVAKLQALLDSLMKAT